MYPTTSGMNDLHDELRALLGPVLDMGPVSDADAIRWIMELKALPDPTPQRLEWIKNLEEAWHQAAAADMARR
ncbi:MAG: hypothetical protein EOP21_03200 [Hyphomicrobiales bacterium]|nr:MAG: hypothetical protein EOP21_03200 [Hyphomicrobiales bacterium]